MAGLDIEQLRAALAASPDNLVLRKMLGDLLLDGNRFDEAETEFRELLSRGATDPETRTGLARCFFKQNKDDEALVLVESLAQSDNPPPEAMAMYVKLLAREGNVEKAVTEYKALVARHPDQVDEAFEETYGVNRNTGMAVDGRARLVEDDDIPIFTEGMLEKPSVTFDDVGGMDELKEEIRMKIIAPQLNPELFAAYGKKTGGGILMYGPPGCGKTYLARATAGEVKAGFMSIGLHDVLDMWIGNSEKNLHQLFEQARMHNPCIMFFDEVDALGASRTDMKQSGGRHLINQFLSELDGVTSSNDGLMILAATNAPWHLDSAFRRPGRFDQIIFVPPPDLTARAGILRILLKDKPLGTIDYEGVAKKCQGFSGADLTAVVNKAVEEKLREAMKKGKAVDLNTKDLVAAAKKVKPSTKEWFSSARNYALYSNESGIYDDILEYLKVL